MILEDKKKFKQIQDDVVKQYEEMAAKDGIKFDATIGIGEDLADISGMAICDEYLENFQEKSWTNVTSSFVQGAASWAKFSLPSSVMKLIMY